MEATHQANDEQTKLWNGPAGHAWINMQALLDQLFKPFENLLVEAVVRNAGHKVLDVGCGTGGTTLAIASRLGTNGYCTGIDISEPMIATAQLRSERDNTPASFICANVQAHKFEPACFDMIISRFGVMFFDDPVQAFSNLKHAARDKAKLRFIAWRSAAENPFMTTAERAAAPLIPNLPTRRPDAPGQFAFGDQHRIYSILHQSGWTDIQIQPIDVACTFPEQNLLQYLTQLGPVGLILQEADEQTRTRVIHVVRQAFDPYVHGMEVRFTAACWMVSATS
ncbi:class I SAM-dependent methyltransferase [Chitinivorax sp. B]|uniref:class I SAM-dependent methyltransferase n=1 Tax=Chitinivorax sp. B TaxID=2502235 RepID=UPI0014858CEA|nr:class I SAM-dependent methyltransferase [Chitinivorax sp. B]